jgi:hypothetical protein
LAALPYLPEPDLLGLRGTAPSRYRFGATDWLNRVVSRLNRGSYDIESRVSPRHDAGATDNLLVLASRSSGSIESAHGARYPVGTARDRLHRRTVFGACFEYFTHRIRCFLNLARRRGSPLFSRVFAFTAGIAP